MTAQITRRNLLAGIAGGIVLHTVPSRLALGLLKPQTTVNPSELAKFRQGLKGQLILPSDRGYDSARRVASFNPTTDKHPQMVVRCVEPNDVIRAVSFARDKAMDVAVRSGGHDLLGASVCDGMVIDLSPMKKMSIDQERKTVRVEAGIRAGELNDLTGSAGLAAVLGCNPWVGVAGLTLGGGLGWFLGKYGAACDNLISADVVTSDSKMLRASATENADLFWALRGGGGNFGIVTTLNLRLHTIGQVLAGVVAYRTDVGRFLGFYRDFMKAAPDELAVELNIFIAEQPTIIAVPCWSGDAVEGRRVLGPLRSFGPPIADNVDLVPYSHLTDRFAIVGKLLPPAPSREASGPGYNYWRGGSLLELSDNAIDQMVLGMQRGPEDCSIGMGHFMHGQVSRVPQNTAPIIRAAGQFTYFFNASWSDPRRGDAKMDWVNRSLAAMKSFSAKGTYINYLSADSDAAVKASYAKNYDRLAKLKGKYDPTNFFHHNRNIRPSSA
jgi:hypothetical protein